jgi:hypothetical protein
MTVTDEKQRLETIRAGDGYVVSAIGIRRYEASRDEGVREFLPKRGGQSERLYGKPDAGGDRCAGE